MLRIGLIGCAHIHTPGFINRMNDRDDVEVLAVWDHDQERARQNADKLSAEVVADVDVILQAENIGAVVICAETDRHLDLVLAAAAAGKHMFVEKPLGIGAEDSARMAAAVEEAGVIFQTGYFIRSQPISRFLKEQVEKGHFGTITRARHSNCHCGSLQGWFDHEWRWMADPTIAGCGAFGDLGTHSLAILMWLFGDDVNSVTASIKVVNGRYGDCDESGEGLLEFASGVTATLAGGWVDVANPIQVLISGTEGHACVDRGKLYFQSTHVDGADGNEPWTDLPDALPHAFELFLDAANGKENVPLVTVREAAARSAVMEAMYQGAAARTWQAPAVIN